MREKTNPTLRHPPAWRRPNSPTLNTHTTHTSLLGRVLPSEPPRRKTTQPCPAQTQRFNQRNYGEETDTPHTNPPTSHQPRPRLPTEGNPLCRQAGRQAGSHLGVDILPVVSLQRGVDVLPIILGLGLDFGLILDEDGRSVVWMGRRGEQRFVLQRRRSLFLCGRRCRLLSALL